MPTKNRCINLLGRVFREDLIEFRRRTDDGLGGLLSGDRLLLSSGDLSVVGLLVESDEKEEVGSEESATEDGGTFSSSARSRSRPGREVGRGEVSVGCDRNEVSTARSRGEESEFTHKRSRQ